MKIANIVVNGVSVRAEGCEKIPKGIVGAQIGLEFTDGAWDGLQKTVVFCGSETRTVLNAGELVTIPWEVVSTAGVDLMVGICGTDPEGTVMIPTLWAELGKVWGAALPSGDPSADPSLPIWAQFLSMVGNLDQLLTEEKADLVKAVNELAQRENLSIEDIEQQIALYLEKNAPGLGVGGKDGYTPIKGVDYWTDTDKTEMVNDVIAVLPVYNGEAEVV